jgi:hypothetical protein
MIQQTVAEILLLVRNYKMYKQVKDPSGNIVTTGIHKLPEMCFIPFDPANTDYQEYLKWLAEGNTPEPADE